MANLTARTWWIVKVKYTKQFDDGSLKRVTESFLFDACSYTDAEARATEEICAKIKGAALITNISKGNFHDVIEPDIPFGAAWWNVKVSMVGYDADSERERRSNINVLVYAEDVIAATKMVRDTFKDSISSFEVIGVTQSPVIEIYPLEVELIEE